MPPEEHEASGQMLAAKTHCIGGCTILSGYCATVFSPQFVPQILHLLPDLTKNKIKTNSIAEPKINDNKSIHELWKDNKKNKKTHASQRSLDRKWQAGLTLVPSVSLLWLYLF